MSEEQTPYQGEGDPPASQVPAIQREKAPLRADGTGVLAIIPRDTEEAQRYAVGLIRANQVPDAFRDGGKKENPVNESLVLMGILKCMELGVAPQTGLAGLLPLNGRFTVWGDLAAALVQQSGQVAKHVDREIGAGFDPDTPLGEWPNDYGWNISYWRKGQDDPYIGSFTVRDAKRAGLWMCSWRKPWILYPKRMLFNRARAFALRDGFADALSGLGIAEEFMDGLPPVIDERGGSKAISALDDEPVTESLPAPGEGDQPLPEQAEREATAVGQDERAGA
jgi:hypothetical protein